MTDTLYRWVKASERLPEIIERKSTPKWVKYMKKRWKGEPYEAKAVAYYFPDHFKTVEWEDWDDYDEKDFPYTENDPEAGCVWLRAGWYSSIDCDKCDGYWSAPLDVIEWLEPYTVPVDVEQAAKNKKESVYNTIKPTSNEKMLSEYSTLRPANEARDEDYSPLQDLFMNEIASHLKLYTTPEVFEKAWTASLFPERLTKACLRVTEQYIDSLPSRPSFNADQLVERLREANPFQRSTEEDKYYNQIWNECCNKAQELLKTKEEK